MKPAHPSGEGSPAAGASGYLAHCRHALAIALRRAVADPGLHLLLESLDEAALEGPGAARERLAAASPRSAARLADASPELLRALEAHALALKGGTRPPGTLLLPVAFATAPPESAAAALRVLGRNVERAREQLARAARDRSDGRGRAFLGLGEAAQRALLERTCVLDGAAAAADPGPAIAALVAPLVPRDRRALALERLEDWWLETALGQLSGRNALPVGARQLEERLAAPPVFRPTDPAIELGSREARAALVRAGRAARAGESEALEALAHPALGALCLAAAAAGWREESDSPLSFPLAFLVLPIALHAATRERLPRTVRTTLAVWLAENPDLAVGFPARARRLVRATRNAVSHALAHRALAPAGAGLAAGTVPAPRGHAGKEDPTGSALHAARFLGRWLARAGSPATVFALWGIRP